MSLFDGVRRVLRIGVWRRELEEELAFHFDQTVQELERDGLSPSAARDEARRRFGDERRWRRELETLDRRTERVRRWEGHGELVRYTVRHALRRLRLSPGFSAGVVLVFALGIGANATMFSILDRVLLNPPAHVREPDDVRRILLEQWEPQTATKVPTQVVSYPDYVAASQTAGLAAVAAVSGGLAVLPGGEGLRRFTAERVTGSLFPLLGVRPFIGRFFTPEEDRVDGTPVAVLSHRMWQQEYGGDPDVLGRALDLEGGPVTIVGVAPPGFTGIDLRPVDLWLPLHSMAGRSGNTYCIETSNCNWLRLVGRLAPGADPAAVQTEITTRLLRLRSDDVERGTLDPRSRVLLTPLVAARGPLASGESQVAIWLAGIAFIVMLIACANVANLMLTRAWSQEREVGVRLALGSSRGRVLGEALVESLLLALIAGALAMLVTRWGGVALRELLLPGIVWDAPGIELRAGLAVLVLSLFAGLSSGVLPALQRRRADVAHILRGGGRGISAPMHRTRAALTIAQSALSLVLLAGAGLFVLSLHRVNSLDLGLDPDGVMSVSLTLQRSVADARRAELRELAKERLRALPGVDGVSVDVSTPFMGTASTTVRPRGVDSVPTLPTGAPSWHRVEPDYFRLMRLDIRRGRALLPDDRAGAPPVAVVNETMARVFWPGEAALGKCLELGYRNPHEPEEELPCVRVVGVVENARQSELTEEESMQFYVPAAQGKGSPGNLLVRFAGNEDDAVQLIRSELMALDRAMQHVEVQPLRDLVDGQARSWRLGATLFSLFGLLALLVASVGLYSVLSYQVSQRRFELGVRAALGAHPLRLAGLVLRRAVLLTGAGILGGMVVAWLAAPRLASLLYDTSPTEPGVYFGVAAVLLGVSLLAAAFPALRATRTDPAAALRAD